jgi:2,3-bisphosphoglycerate-dependent phosphoglycerate mutase
LDPKSSNSQVLVVKNLYVVTHPQSQHHTDGRVGGWFDNELTDLGLRQAANIARRIHERLPQDAPVELYSSDLLRAYQTAEVIAQRLRVPIQTTPDLREKSYGEAEGKPQDWLDERFIYPQSSAIGWITAKGSMAQRASASLPKEFIAQWIVS